MEYLSDAKMLNTALVRSIKRLVICRNNLEALFEMNFYKIIINKLIRRNCILTRYYITFIKFLNHKIFYSKKIFFYILN